MIRAHGRREYRYGQMCLATQRLKCMSVRCSSDSSGMIRPNSAQAAAPELASRTSGDLDEGAAQLHISQRTCFPFSP